MMKKNGFTLAEVLITLAIIGVVATMTLPALMTNTAEQQARTGLKKGINTLTEAAQMNLALENWDYAGAYMTNAANGITTSHDLTAMSFDSLIANRTAIDYAKGTALPTRMNTNMRQILTSHKAVYFKDGTAIYYNPSTAIATNTNAKLAADGLPVGYDIVFDTNGQSGPNILSNCSTGGPAPFGTAEWGVSSTAYAPVSAINAAGACAKKNYRLVGDMFVVRLRGGYAIPQGNASTWILGGDVGSGS